MARQKLTPEQRKDRMLTQPPQKIILSMAFPAIIAFLINSIYSLADTFFVSSLGTNATAAVSVNASLDQIILMAGSMLAIGANSFIARLLGARNDKKAAEVLSTAFVLAVLFGALLSVLGVSFMRPMVRLLGATPTCERYAIDYATYVLLAAPFMASSFVMNQCLRAEGNAIHSMIGMGFGGILNCVLDPIFIFEFGLGVAGASLATAISKLVSFLILIYPYVRRKSLLRLSLRNFRFTKEIVGQITAVGSSAMLRSGFSVIAGIVLNNIAGGISDSVLAGIGVSTKVMMFPFGIILGFGTGFQPVAGFNYGAKRFDRVLDSYRFASRAALLGAAGMALLLGLFSNQVIALFTVTDEKMLEIGALCIRAQCLALPIHAWVAVVNMFCAGLGRAKNALVLSTSRQGSCFLPIVFLLPRLFGAYGVASVQAVADVLTLALAVPIIRRLRRELNTLQQAQEEALLPPA